MKQLLSCFILIITFHVQSASGQNLSKQINGTVNTPDGMPASCTIRLTSASDSLFNRTTTTNEKGEFHFASIPFQNLIIRIDAVGYKTIIQKVDLSIGNSNHHINYTLAAAETELQTVNIRQKKNIIERKPNKLVMHVENSPSAIGNTALEILSKVPGVAVNQEGNITVKGRSGVSIMIDGKLTYLSPEQLSIRLKSLNGNEIQSIELMSSPSANFDAAGNAGIINIKLKTNKNYGTNGSLNAGFGYGKNPKSDFGLSLNHRTQNINIFGNYSNNNTKQDEDLDITRVADAVSSSTYFKQYNTQTRSAHNNSYKFGIDVKLNRNNTLGILTSGYLNDGHDRSVGRTDIGATPLTTDSSVFSNNPTTSNYRNQSYNLNYKSVLDTLGQELSVDVDYVRYRNLENTTYNNSFVNNVANASAPLIFRNATPADIQIWAAKIDYNLPIGSSTKLELGLKSSWVNSDNDFRFENLIAGVWENDVSRSNRFVYKENIHAAYGVLKQQLDKTDVELGLRIEQTNSIGNSITDQKQVKRNYLDFFPSLSINRHISEQHELGFSYSRRINRPDYKSLNPFVYFVDLYTFVEGNPFVNPEYTHSFDLTYSYKKALNLSFGYSSTKNLITDVFLTTASSNALFQTVQNLDRQHWYTLTIGQPLEVTKFWSIDNTVTSVYTKIKSNDLGGLPYNRGKFNISLNTTQTFNINASTNIELSGDYQSQQIYGTYALQPYYGIDLGIAKSILDKRLTIKLALNDVFDTRRARVSSTLSNLHYNLNQKLETRVFRLNLSYAFGSQTIKAGRARKVSTEESRVKQ